MESIHKKTSIQNIPEVKTREYEIDRHLSFYLATLTILEYYIIIINIINISINIRLEQCLEYYNSTISRLRWVTITVDCSDSEGLACYRLLY